MVWRAVQYDDCYDAFLAGADKIVTAKTKAAIAKLLQIGDRARPPLCTAIKGYSGIYEVRTTGSRHVRGIFFINKERKEIVFTSFHLKKSRKLPSAVFEQAARIKKAYDNGSQRLTQIN